MMKIIRLVLIGVLLFVIITVVSFVYLKWWQALAVVLAMIVGRFLYIRYLIANLGKDPRQGHDAPGDRGEIESFAKRACGSGVA